MTLPPSVYNQHCILYSMRAIRSNRERLCCVVQNSLNVSDVKKVDHTVKYSRCVQVFRVWWCVSSHFLNFVSFFFLLFLHISPSHSCHLFLAFAPRLSIKWWAQWLWCVWMRTAWRHSSAWTRSSARWTKITMTRSRWRSSKKQPRVTPPSSSYCSVTCRSKREEGWGKDGAEIKCTDF